MGTRYFEAQSELAEGIVGTTMDPPRLFAQDADIPDDPAMADTDWFFETIGEFPAGSLTVGMTRCGGLYVRRPKTLADDSDANESRLRFTNDAASAINLVLCEMALSGQVSAPASPAQMAGGGLFEGVTAFSKNARQDARGRTTDLVLQVYSSHWVGWPVADPAIIRTGSGLPRAVPLRAISPTIPDFVGSAYYNLSRHQLAEGLLSAWIVVEQLLDHLWRRHIDGASEEGRKAKLNDTRTFTAAVRAEVLLASGRLSVDLYRGIELARQARNNLAHRGDVSVGAAHDAARALQALLEHILATDVTAPQVIEISL